MVCIAERAMGFKVIPHIATMKPDDAFFLSLSLAHFNVSYNSFVFRFI